MYGNTAFRKQIQDRKLLVSMSESRVWSYSWMAYEIKRSLDEQTLVSERQNSSLQKRVQSCGSLARRGAKNQTMTKAGPRQGPRPGDSRVNRPQWDPQKECWKAAYEKYWTYPPYIPQSPRTRSPWDRTCRQGLNRHMRAQEEWLLDLEDEDIKIQAGHIRW